MTITISVGSFEELKELANKIEIRTDAVIMQQDLNEAVKAAVEEPVKEAPVEEAPVITLEVIRAKIKEYTRSDRKAEVKDILGRFGATTATNLSPDNYAAFMEACNA